MVEEMSLKMDGVLVKMEIQDVILDWTDKCKDNRTSNLPNIYEEKFVYRRNKEFMVF